MPSIPAPAHNAVRKAEYIGLAIVLGLMTGLIGTAPHTLSVAVVWSAVYWLVQYPRARDKFPDLSRLRLIMAEGLYVIPGGFFLGCLIRIAAFVWHSSG